MSASARKVSDYAGAVYPCVVYEVEGGEEYAACSPAHLSGHGYSDESAEDAVEDLRKRIETDIREIIQNGRTWFECADDHELVPLPSELPLPQDDDEEWHLDFAHFVSKLCTITQVTRTTVKLSNTL